MKMTEARAAIGDAVSAAITDEFTRDQQQWLGDVPPPLAMVAGRHAAGHDASKVPAAPRPAVADPGHGGRWLLRQLDARLACTRLRDDLHCGLGARRHPERRVSRVRALATAHPGPGPGNTA
jgi:hypothetical protein